MNCKPENALGDSGKNGDKQASDKENEEMVSLIRGLLHSELKEDLKKLMNENTKEEARRKISTNDEVDEEMGEALSSNGNQVPEAESKTETNNSTLTVKRPTSSSTETDEDDKENLLPEDTFSFFALIGDFDWKRQSFWFALGVFVVQLLTLSLLAVDVIDLRNEDNPLGIPAGVEFAVRLSQLIALCITVISQSEVHQSCNVLFNGYQELKDAVEILKEQVRYEPRPRWFYVSSISRFLAGSLSISVTFMLIMREDSVRDVLLNFTAVEFISSVDDVVFTLAGWGYFGASLKSDADKVSESKRQYEEPKNGFWSYVWRIIKKGWANVRKRTTTLVDKITGSTRPESPTESSTTATNDQEETTKVRFPRLLCLSVIFLILMGFWVWIVISQERGDFLPPNVYVQFGDEFSATLGTFSGIYKLDSSKKRTLILGDRVKYNARNPGRFDHSAQFEYCDKDRFWSFTFGDDPNNIPGACNFRARSSESLSFDITETLSDPWFYLDPESGNEVPLQHFSMEGLDDFSGSQCKSDSECGDELTCRNRSCVCEDSTRFGVRCQYHKPCETIEIDDPLRPFSDVLGTWSTKFKILDVEGFTQVYDHPMYLGNEPCAEGNLEILLYTGRRWVLTHTGKLGDLRKRTKIINETIIADYVTQEFHPHWVDFKAAFVSEPVDVDTPTDALTPVGLRWFHASLGQAPDLSRPIDASLLCATCDAETNPCDYEGECQDNGICKCTVGSTGTLCQIPLLLSDGHCDPFFNTDEFNYDKGDCCPDSCTSKEANACGTEVDSEERVTFIGYPKCIDPAQVCSPPTEPCWNRLFETVGEGNVERTGNSVALSGNGRYLAYTKTGSGEVFVLEQDGSEWLVRGQPFAPPANFTSHPFVDLSFDGSTLAVGWCFLTEGNCTFNMFEWETATDRWRPLDPDIVNGIQVIDSVSLSDSGTVVAVGRVDTSVSIYQFNNQSNWTEIGSDGLDDAMYCCGALSLSGDGSVLTVGNGDRRSVAAYKYDANLNPTWSPIGPALTVNEAGFGDVVSLSAEGAILAVGTKKNCGVRVFQHSPSDGVWAQLGKFLDIGGANCELSLSLSRTGEVLAVGNPNAEIQSGHVRVYEYRDSASGWNILGAAISGTTLQELGASVSLSQDGRILGIGSPIDGTVSVFWNPPQSIDLDTPTEDPRVPITTNVNVDTSAPGAFLSLVCGNLIYDVEQKIILVPEGSLCELRILSGGCHGGRGSYEIHYGRESASVENLLSQGSQICSSAETINFFAVPPTTIMVPLVFSFSVLSDNPNWQSGTNFVLDCTDVLKAVSAPEALDSRTSYVPETSYCTVTFPLPTASENVDFAVRRGSSMTESSELVSATISLGQEAATLRIPVFSECEVGHSLHRVMISGSLGPTLVWTLTRDDGDGDQEVLLASDDDRVVAQGAIRKTVCVPEDACTSFSINTEGAPVDFKVFREAQLLTERNSVTTFDVPLGGCNWTLWPTVAPSAAPSGEPSEYPSPFPTPMPTPRPTPFPTPKPTSKPTPLPTPVPTKLPTPPTPVPTIRLGPRTPWPTPPIFGVPCFRGCTPDRPFPGDDIRDGGA